MRVAFAGTPEFARPALEALCAQHQVVGVLTQPDRPKGRGRKLAASAVKGAALERGLPLAQPPTLKSDAAQAVLSAWAPEVLVVVAYGLLLPPPVLALPRYGCLNIHASLLPRWRGAAPIQRAILAGDERTGITVMQMDAGLDTGPILLQRPLEIGAGDSGGSLHDALAHLGAEAILEALSGLTQGTLGSQSQPAQGATYAPKIQKSEARIDWSQDAASIDRQIRAFNPWPIAETTFEGEPLRIHAARPHPDAREISSNVSSLDPKNAENGSIIAVQDDFVLVKCAQRTLAVTRLQQPGRKPVGARDFSHGRHLVGLRLG